MAKTKKEEIKSNLYKITFITIIIILLALSFYIAKPFLIAIISGILLAFIFYPIYKLFLTKIKNKTTTAIITTLIILLFFAIPVLLMGNVMAKETANMFLNVKNSVITGDIITKECTDNGLICVTIQKINTALLHPESKSQIISFVNKIVAFIAEKLGEIIISIPGMILNLAIALFTTFYFLRDGDKFIQLIKNTIPIDSRHQEKIMFQLIEVVKALVYGTLIIAVVQGLLTMIGFFIFGVPSPILWGAVTMFFALIPFVGAWVVWFPASMYLLFSGYVHDQNSLIWKGIGLALYGMLIISTSDNWLKPILVGERAKVHPILILVGVLGGLIAFGFIGIILGPLILAMMQKVIEIYATDLHPGFKINNSSKK